MLIWLPEDQLALQHLMAETMSRSTHYMSNPRVWQQEGYRSLQEALDMVAGWAMAQNAELLMKVEAYNKLFEQAQHRREYKNRTSRYN